MGGILLAADETGLTGLWLDGQKYFGGHLPAELQDTGNADSLQRPDAGWIFILPAESRISFLRCILSALHSGRRYGRFF